MSPGFKKQHQQDLEDFAAIKVEEEEDGSECGDDDDLDEEGAAVEAGADGEDFVRGDAGREADGSRDGGHPEASEDLPERSGDCSGEAFEDSEGDSTFGDSEEELGEDGEGDKDGEVAGAGKGDGGVRPGHGGGRQRTVQTPLGVRSQIRI